MHGLSLAWWVQEKHISASAVAAALAAGDLVLLALELPTGWFADRIGHRVSLIVGSSAQVLGLLFCWLADGMAGVVAGTLLIAVGDAFRSGADQALLYRSCLAVDRLDEFHRLNARAWSIEGVLLALLVVTGGAIVAAWGYHAGWAIETALSAAGLAIAWSMREPPAGAGKYEEGTPAAGVVRLASDAWDVSSAVGEHEARHDDSGLSTRSLLRLILPVACLDGLGSAASFLAQTGAITNPTYLAAFVALIGVAQAAGSAIAARLPQHDARRQGVLAVTGLWLFALGFAAAKAWPFVAIAISLMAGVALPLRATMIQELASDTMRARAASIASACDTAVSMLILPIAGVWRSRRSGREPRS
jgi:MFS family permease